MADGALAMSADATLASPAEAERRVARTRVHLALTLDALEHKLAARQLVQKGFDMFNQNVGLDRFGQQTLDVIRANPVPVALIGLGAAWLIAANSVSEEQLAAARRRVGGMANDLGARAGEMASAAAGKAGLSSDEPLGRTGNTIVDETGNRSNDGWLHQIADATQGALRSARDASEAMVGESATRVSDQLTAAFERNPIVVGTIAAMTGALLAALLPMSRTESRLLGDAELQRKAGEVGDEAVARVRGVAAQTLHQAAAAVGGAPGKSSPF